MSGPSIIHSGYWHTPSPDTVSPQPQTQNLHSVPIHLIEVLPSRNSKDFKIISTRESGAIFYKKMMNDENERRRKMFHSPKRVGKKWSSNKETKFHSKCESTSFLSLGHFIFHKIRFWLSSNPSRITIQLGNTGK